MAEIADFNDKKKQSALILNKSKDKALTASKISLLWPSQHLSRGGEIGRRGGFKIRCQR